MRANINGVDLYYEVHGDGEPVLCVHGFPHSGELWTPVIEPLKGRCRLIVPDLRGLGRSGVGPASSIRLYSDDLVALLEHIGENRPVVLMGLSLGGAIAFDFFRRYRDRLRALVLVDARAEPDTVEAARGREEKARSVLADGSRIIADAMRDALFSPKTPDALKDKWHGIMASAPPEGVAGALRALKDRVNSVPTLQHIDVPTLIVVGEDDAITPPDGQRRMQEAIRGSRLEIIAAAGHMTPVEAPQAFVDVFRDFLDKLPGRA